MLGRRALRTCVGSYGADGSPGELRLLLVWNVGDGSSERSVRGFLLGYRLGGLKVDAANAGSLGDGWKGASCVRGVSGGDEIASPKIW